jgi:hypothetical protein
MSAPCHKNTNIDSTCSPVQQVAVHTMSIEVVLASITLYVTVRTGLAVL